MAETSLAPARKTAVVAGGSSGIGLATAVALAEAGSRVHVLARSAADGPFTSHQVDLTDPAAARGALEEIGDREGIDILVCSAGANIPDRRLDQLDAQRWRHLIAANLDTVFNTLRPALDYLRRSRGHAIVLGSVSGFWPDASGPAYQAAKAGLLAFVRAAAFEELGNGVRFTTIRPGMVETAILERRPAPIDPAIRAHLLQPEDVAATVVFVAGLPARANISELEILPTLLQVSGQTVFVKPPPQ